MITPVQSNAQIETVAQLAKETWTEHYTPIIGVDQVEYMLAKFQSFEAIKNQIQNERFRYFLIEANDVNVGYFAVQLKTDHLYLSKLYVKALERGKGFGKSAMGFIEKLAEENKYKKILLNVNRNNHNSIKAYEKMGFVKSDTVEVDIGEGYAMCDYVMEKKCI